MRARALRDAIAGRPEVLSPVLLLGFALIGWFGAEAKPSGVGAAWPSWTHPFGLDRSGRDFLSVVSGGVADFIVPGLCAVAALLLALALRSWLALQRPVLPSAADAETAGGLAAASPPRLLLVLVGMLLLEEPSPLLAAAIVFALYLPVALQELSSQLSALRQQEVLAGAMAHGLPMGRVLRSYLLAGYLKELLGRHSAALFTQVAFTQIALAYVFGASSVRGGLSLSWGAEFERLAPFLMPPRKLLADLTGASSRADECLYLGWQSCYGCLSGGVCTEAVSGLQALLLLLIIMGLLGGLLLLAQPRVQGGGAWLSSLQIHLRQPRVRVPGRLCPEGGLDIVVEPGRRTVLMGRSGAGKTLLARLALGQLPRFPVLTTGSAVLRQGDSVHTIDFSHYPPGAVIEDLAQLRGDELSFVPQGGRENLVPGWTVRDHFAALLPGSVEQSHHGLDEALAGMQALGVDPSASNLNAVATGLSEGMIRRILISLAMARGARVLIIDEPTTGLDPASRDAFRELLETRLIDSGAGLLLITHDVELAQDLRGETLLVDGGVVVARTDDLQAGEGPFAPFIEAMQMTREAM